MTAQAKPEPTGAEIVPLRQREPLPDEVVLAIAAGNIAPLEPRMRAVAIRAICEDGNLPVSLSPVILIPGDGGALKPYVTSIGASWVADNKRVSTKVLATGTESGVYFVRMLAVAGDGRSVEDVGAVSVQGQTGQNLANSWMKAHTKAYRRAVLRLAGLPLTDEDEGTGPPRRIDYDSGEVIDAEATVVPRSSGNADRAAALKDLNERVRDRFGTDEEIARAFAGITAKQVRDDLVCWAYGLAAFRDATPAQVAEAALAIGGWTKEGAKQRYLLLEAANAAKTLSMATDVATVAAEEGITDAFVVGAIGRALARFESEAASQMADVDAAVDSAVIG